MSRLPSNNGQNQWSEFIQLAHTANIQILEKISQRRHKPEHGSFFGTGKIQELKEIVLKTKANLVIFNHRLSGVQSRNLSKILQTPVWERNQLILKIFADRARSYEGKLQVELAQRLDDLARVRGAWLGSLSRQGGGRSTKGPGEKALETDRRQIQNRIRVLRKKLQSVRQTRTEQRKQRKKNKTPGFALIGYTNSGKSTLLNSMCRAKAPCENQLFLTLDPLARKVFIPDLGSSVLTDTVGFIQDLPPHLISAFKATLEESSFADVLLHLIDLSSPNMLEQTQTVNSLIKDFGWSEKPIIHVYNKTDIELTENKLKIPNTPFRAMISAQKGDGIEHLLREMRRAYLSLNHNIELFFPKNKEHKIYSLGRQAEIHKILKSQRGTLLKAGLSREQIPFWKSFIVS